MRGRNGQREYENNIDSTVEQSSNNVGQCRLPIRPRTEYENRLVKYNLQESERHNLFLHAITRFASNKFSNQVRRLPLRKMLGFFSRLFLLNGMELVHLQCLLSELEWSTVQDFLKNNSKDIGKKVDVGKERPTDLKTFDEFSLLLMLLCLQLKSNLDGQERSAISSEVDRIFEQKFEQILKAWRSIFEPKITLKNFNAAFKTLSAPPKDIDYNCMVELILDISPSYETPGDKKKKATESSEESESIDNLNRNMEQIVEEPLTVPILNGGRGRKKTGKR